MIKLLKLIVCIFVSINCQGQRADELNKQAKDFLSKNDFKNAVPLLKKAAEAGNAEAEYNYGVSFQQGIEVAQDDKIANEWFLKSAKQDWRDAQFKVAYNYQKGRGCGVDYKESFYWSLKCAQQNDPDCMFNVVSCYLQGFGTDKNMDSMLMWAIRLGSLPDVENLAQSSNITSARLNIARMYRDGDKVEKDLMKSYMWFLIYNESKRDFSWSEQQKNIDEIMELEKNLTKKGKNEASKAAGKQIGRPLKNLDNLYKPEIN